MENDTEEYKEFEQDDAEENGADDAHSGVRKHTTVCAFCHNPLGSNTVAGTKAKKHDRYFYP